MPDKKSKQKTDPYQEAIDRLQGLYQHSLDTSDLGKALSGIGSPVYKDYTIPNAYTRLTQTPIVVKQSHYIEPGYSEPSSGSYFRPTEDWPHGVIKIMTNPGRNWNDFHNTLAHETIHAALQNYGQADVLDKGAVRDKMPSFWPMEDAMWNAHRAGNPVHELPAYLETYDPKQNFMNVTPQQQQDFLQQYHQQLYPATQHILDRIVDAYHASQNPPLKAY